MRKLAAIILTALIVCPRVSEGHTFTGRVERVIDGDTIVVRVIATSTNRASPLACDSLQRVRLAEIDAPEMKTPYGPKAKRALSDMVLGKVVEVIWKRRGRYRRIIGEVYFDEEWVNRSLVGKGWARHHQRYSRTDELAAAERRARQFSAGIWRGP